jgi:hypothetical protein
MPVLDGLKRYGTPDIVIHHRGRIGPSHNLLVAEFKNTHGRIKDEEDVKKVRNAIELLGYRYGAVVSLDRRRGGHREFAPQGLWYENDAGIAVHERRPEKQDL